MSDLVKEKTKRKFVCGAEFLGTSVSFRVWAPKCFSLEVVFQEGRAHALHPEGNGYFSGLIENVEANSIYKLRLDHQNLYPDPASRFQPSGPKGPSQLVDPDQFKWTDQNWKGLEDKSKALIYELHIGTFTPEGTWTSALHKLPYLAELGITVIEMMPVTECCGHFNWGYDGVNIFAPTRNYGQPDDLRAFIDEAHRLGLAVILDVVYNHFGPDGNYLQAFSDHYFHETETEWGRAINYDGKGSRDVRDYFIANARYWIEEFHFDGLRIDACHAIKDSSSIHVLAEMTEELRKRAKNKKLYITAENEQQKGHFTKSVKEGGYGMDAVWNEDFHHTAYVRLTGHNEAYCYDYGGSAQEFVSVAKYGFLYQGQWYSWQKKGRGTPCLDKVPSSFVNFLENHDQVSNSGGSLRLRHFSQPGAYRALTTFLLLAPQIPLLFQGQEFGTLAPFHYFSEQNPELQNPIYEGRTAFVVQFPSFNDDSIKKAIPKPHDEQTFLNSKLIWNEFQNPIFQLYKDLIGLRKKDAVFSQMDMLSIDGAALTTDCFIIRYSTPQEDRLLLINLGLDHPLIPLPEPLAAPREGCEWKILWSSEKIEYGGFGNLPLTEDNWRLSGQSALILASAKKDPSNE